MKNNFDRNQRATIVAALVLAVGLAGGAQAATPATQCANGATTVTWDNATSELWGNASGGLYTSMWTAGNDAVFEGTAATVSIAAAGATARNLTFTNVTGNLITNNTLTLSGTTPTVAVGPG